MSQIISIRIEADSHHPRKRTICDECGGRRMCTLHSGHIDYGGRVIGYIEELWFCNPCMTATPPWPKIRR